jgi:glycine cleavage system H protein
VPNELEAWPKDIGCEVIVLNRACKPLNPAVYAEEGFFSMEQELRKSGRGIRMAGRGQRKYSSSHHWVHVEGTRAVIGITEYGQTKAGFILYAELPDPDERVVRQQYYGLLESANEEYDLLAPVTGRVVDVNDRVRREPSIINMSPEDQGWLFIMELERAEELDLLWEEENYLSRFETAEE